MPARSLKLEGLVLARGKHDSPEDGMCLIEAVAYVAGEKFSDHPACVSPVLAAFGRAWNDGLRSDAERAQLVQYVPRLVGTANGAETERARSMLALDWLVRVHTPAFLDLVPALCEHATKLRGLAPIVDVARAEAAGPIVRAAWDAAGAAAGAAAWDAAGDAAVAAAWDAAGDAAWAAAGDAAWAAAGDAAGAAARAAARAAAGDAAGDALEPTVKTLQVSAHGLFDRMIRAGGPGSE